MAADNARYIQLPKAEERTASDSRSIEVLQEERTSERLKLGTDARTVEEMLNDADLSEDITGQTPLTLKGKVVWGTETDLDENAYGAAAVALVRDIPKFMMEREENMPWAARWLTISRLAFSLGVMAVNLIFQVVILGFIYKFVCLPAVKNVQDMYHDFHALAFTPDGQFVPEAWQETDMTGCIDFRVCQITMSNRPFYYGILLLWALLMMTELRSCQRVAQDILELQNVETTGEMLTFVSENEYGMELGGKCLVIGLTRPIKAAVIALVCVPRAIIGFCLLWLGCQWLSASATFADMTLNAMALEFVKNIDEILYEAILPRGLKKQIADTNVFRIQPRKRKKDVDQDDWDGFKSTLAWIGFMGVFLLCFGQATQTVLPTDLTELGNLCKRQLTVSQTPICSYPSWGGWSEQCYPFGVMPDDLRCPFKGGVHAHGRSRHHHGR